MNNKLDELADKIGLALPNTELEPGTVVVITNAKLVEFAELVIRECARISEYQMVAVAGMPDRMAFNKGCVKSSISIKKHFGLL